MAVVLVTVKLPRNPAHDPRNKVTVKLPRNPAHDPRNKVTGLCPVNGFRCTDVTGEHHTMMVAVPLEDDTEAAMRQAEAYVQSEHPGIHITRSEASPWAHEA